MKSVIYIDTKPETKEKPVEFTHYLVYLGWADTENKPQDFEKVIYLGKCRVDGDMFAVHEDGVIRIFKGHLNSGKY